MKVIAEAWEQVLSTRTAIDIWYQVYKKLKKKITANSSSTHADQHPRIKPQKYLPLLRRGQFSEEAGRL